MKTKKYLMNKRLLIGLIVSLSSFSAFAEPARMQFVPCPQEMVDRIKNGDALVISALQEKYSKLNSQYKSTRQKLNEIAAKYGFRSVADMAFSLGAEEKIAETITLEDQKLFEDLYFLSKDQLASMEENGLSHCVQIIESI